MKARLPKGYSNGGASDMNSMIKNAQKVQDDIMKVQQELELEDYNISVGGGAVELIITGKKEIKSLTIKPEIVDPDDIEMLQDLIISAVNQGITTVEETSDKEISKLTGGLSFPGLL